MENLALQALFYGLVAGVALPLGSISAGLWNFRERTVAAITALGAGALLAALTLDLVSEQLHKGEFYTLALGCILGGLIFELLNQVVNEHGGFLRKTATTFAHLRKQKLQTFKQLARKLSQVPLLHQLPPEEVRAILPFIIRRSYRKGTTLFRQGEPGDSLLIVERGQVDIVDVKGGGRKVATLGENQVIGEMALLTGEPRSAMALAANDLRVWIILKEDFDRVLDTSPHLAEAVKILVDERLADMQRQHTIDPERAAAWHARAVHHLDERHVILTATDIKEAAAAHGGAPMAIWLGALLDGIPESLVLGASMLHASVSTSLIAGIFLSNFPEALSSSSGMRQQHFPHGKILWMWTSLMLISGVGAFLGNLLFAEAPPYLFALIEGVAAGAMLTMVAETMLPEAYHKGGTVTGMSTLVGFLLAIFFKTLE
ncbi:MAG: cyclic nucleotide-binding domain-containing protein [Candidatus Latescibacteria bacterium]|nr:cyclic nucleotide-binding domain-containing protein [Candidatus Latescibacterota bacterium]